MIVLCRKVTHLQEKSWLNQWFLQEMKMENKIFGTTMWHEKMCAELIGVE